MGPKKKRLIGIKAIADYLSTSERNIYRWEKKLGLPIQRVAGSKGHSVYIYLEDLEKWYRNKASLLSVEGKPKYKIPRMFVFKWFRTNVLIF